MYLAQELLRQEAIDEGIEKGIEQGIEQGKEQIIVDILKKHKSYQEIADFMGYDLAYVKEVAEKYNL